MGLREEKRERLRREILDAAISLLQERGYDRTRVKDIVERVRVSEATFFNYFPTKEALLREFALDTIEQYAALLRHEIETKERSVPDRIRELSRVLALFFTSHREFMRIAVTKSNIFAGAEGVLAQKEHQTYEMLATLFREGQARGEIRNDSDALQLAEILTAVNTLTITNWLTGWWKKPGELEARVLRAVAVFLNGCQADHECRIVRSGPETRRFRSPTPRRRGHRSR
jgi:AcrR family transcriptional regulator